MSAQLSLDSLGGINWESPRLEQLEQFALDHGFDNVSIAGGYVHIITMNGSAALRPWMQRTASDTLEWVVLLQTLKHPRPVELRSDAELVAALAAVFEEGK